MQDKLLLKATPPARPLLRTTRKNREVTKFTFGMTCSLIPRLRQLDDDLSVL